MNNSFLSSVSHDIRSNTLEATWLEEVTDELGVVIDYRRKRCHNYSAEQKADFLADLGEDVGQKYVALAGW